MRPRIAHGRNLDAVTDAIIVDVEIVDDPVAIVVQAVADLGRRGALADTAALAAIVPQFQPAMQSDVLPQVVVHTFVPVLSGMQIPPGQLELSAHPLAPAAPPPPLEPLAPARPVVTIAGSVDELPPVASPPPPPPTTRHCLRPSQYCLRQDHFDTRQPRWLSHNESRNPSGQPGRPIGDHARSFPVDLPRGSTPP